MLNIQVAIVNNVRAIINLNIKTFGGNFYTKIIFYFNGIPVINFYTIFYIAALIKTQLRSLA